MATITSAASGNSNTPGTWVGGVVPGPADDVIIAGHVITLNADHTWNSLILSSTASRINPDAGPRVLNITTFWRHTAAVAASACTPPTGCTFTVNLGFFDHTTNQTQYTFGVTNTNCTLNILSNDATPANGNLFDPAGVATTLFVTCTQATSTVNVTGYFQTAAGTVTALFNFTGGTLVHTANLPTNCLLAATAKYFQCSGTGIINATLTGYIGNAAVSSTGYVTVNNANATVTINGDAYNAIAGGAGAVMHVANGILILNGKASHLAGTNTLTVWVAGGQFRWENQNITIGASEAFTLYATAGLIDLDNLVIDNSNRVVGILSGASTFSTAGFQITNNPGAYGAFNFVDLTVINTPDPAPALPPQGKVEAGQSYGYAASPLTGTGLILDPVTLASALTSADVATGTDIDSVNTNVDVSETAILTAVGNITVDNNAIATAVRSNLDSSPINVNASSLDEAAIASINAVVDLNRYSIIEHFSGANGANLNTVTPTKNATGLAWKKLNGQNILLDGSGGAYTVADDSTQAGILYGVDAGSENYIYRVLVNGPSTNYYQMHFRVDPAKDTYYALYVRQNTSLTFFNIIERREAENVRTVATGSVSLTGSEDYTFQIRVTGSVVTAVVEGVDHTPLTYEMDFNLDKSWIGIGGTRAGTTFKYLSVEPMPSSLSVNALTSELDLIQETVDGLYTVPAQAISFASPGIAEDVRTKLATELAYLDAAVSSRLPTASYVDPATTAEVEAARDAVITEIESIAVTGSGQRQIVVSVKDEDLTAVSGVRVSVLTIGGTATGVASTTSTGGTVTFNLDDATYKFRVTPPSGYETPSDATVVVNSDETPVAITLTAVELSASDDPAKCMVRFGVRDAGAGNLASVTISAWPSNDAPTVDGAILANVAVQAVTDATGYAELELPRSAALTGCGSKRYRFAFTNASGKVYREVEREIPDAAAAWFEDILNGTV